MVTRQCLKLLGGHTTEDKEVRGICICCPQKHFSSLCLSSVSFLTLSMVSTLQIQQLCPRGPLMEWSWGVGVLVSCFSVSQYECRRGS